LVSTAFYLGKEKLRHSLGRPSRSDFVQLGFEEYGKFPNNMRYSDATYADALWMMKKL